VRVEYDDGKPAKHSAERVPQARPKGRNRGFYVVLPSGKEFRLPVSFMRVSEMGPTERVLNAILAELADATGREPVG
jgi:hypothetical protein